MKTCGFAAGCAIVLALGVVLPGHAQNEPAKAPDDSSQEALANPIDKLRAREELLKLRQETARLDLQMLSRQHSTMRLESMLSKSTEKADADEARSRKSLMEAMDQLAMEYQRVAIELHRVTREIREREGETQREKGVGGRSSSFIKAGNYYLNLDHIDHVWKSPAENPARVEVYYRDRQSPMIVIGPAAESLMEILDRRSR